MKDLINKVLNKKLVYSLVGLLIISTTISVYSFMQPITSVNQINQNSSQIQTNYDYSATIKPNILYPNGGTVEVGDTIFKKITTEIPVKIDTKITSDNPVTVKGSHEVQLLVKAGELWERAFPLEEKQKIEQEGTEVPIINGTYEIDIEKISGFITQVEEETGIRTDQYQLVLIPNLEGTISYGGVEKPIQAQDNLNFQYTYDEIKLASEKSYGTVVPFTRTQVVTNNFGFSGIELPLVPIRTASTVLSILLLAIILYASRDMLNGRNLPTDSEVRNIGKKYGSRIVTVSHKINIAQKSLFTLDSFKSLLKVADERELPIFCNKSHQDVGAVYFIVDGDYLYSYESGKLENLEPKGKHAGSEKTYARG